MFVVVDFIYQAGQTDQEAVNVEIRKYYLHSNASQFPKKTVVHNTEVDRDILNETLAHYLNPLNGWVKLESRQDGMDKIYFSFWREMEVYVRP